MSVEQFLMVVESPSKANTIKKYLSNNFQVLASYGHVRDLIPKSGAVDIENNFEPKYKNIEKNEQHVATIMHALKKASALYLALDQDREGEAIAWHIHELMNEKGLLKNKAIYRIVFNEVTKSAIQDALKSPREISMNLVNAQVSRRILDYLVGFNLSPLLWKKIFFGLSAGRVQSPALKLIVDRESEIEQFNSQEYWSVLASLNCDMQQKFTAKLAIYSGEKLKQFSIVNQEQAKIIEINLLNISNNVLKVIKIEKKQKKRNPSAPFITSTLQQEAVRKLGFSAQYTMKIAQQLYEGIEINNRERTGLITYMRTDSVQLSTSAIQDIREVISEKFGLENLPATVQIYKTKTKNAQEAHEAIRPTYVKKQPEEIKKYLTEDQLKLYTLIWKRTVASQMVYAIIDMILVDLQCGNDEKNNNIFRTTGSSIFRKGFMELYLEDKDDLKLSDDEYGSGLLPNLEIGQKIDLLNIHSVQHFTEPPARYSEASLIKILEEYGIGRPSTYASIIDVLLKRKYVVLSKNKKFYPTDIGKIVSEFLKKYFTKYVDYGFTAHLEDSLDEIARGERKKTELLVDFWVSFKNTIDEVAKTVSRQEIMQKITDKICPLCKSKLVVKFSRIGKFIGCTGYKDKECKYTEQITKLNDENCATENAMLQNKKCPNCNAELTTRIGKYGKFVGCTGYPKCKYIESFSKSVDTQVKCPVCKSGNLFQRKSRYGKYFYSCEKYPQCVYIVQNKPISEKCPKCGWDILTLKVTKRLGKEKICPKQKCGYSLIIGDNDEKVV